MELNPESVALRLFYGQFLLHTHQLEQATREFRVGLKLDSTAVPIRIELARCELFVENFDESLKILKPLLDAGVQLESAERHCRKAWDLALQTHRRRGAAAVMAKDFFAALKSAESFRETMDSCPAAFRDERMRDQLPEVERISTNANRFLDDLEMKARALSMVEWCEAEAYRGMSSHPTTWPAGRQYGKVTSVVKDRNFAYLQMESNGIEFFLDAVI